MADRAATTGAQLERERAFGRLVDRELASAYRTASLLLHDPAEAEDATQDALERAWQRWDQLRDPDRAGAWFGRTTAGRRGTRCRSTDRWTLTDVGTAAHLLAWAPHSAHVLHGGRELRRAGFLVGAMVIATACASPQPSPSAAVTRSLATSTPDTSSKSPLPSCGIEVSNGPNGPWNIGARTCFWAAYRAGEPAEFTSTMRTVEGDPVTTIYRVLGPGEVEVIEDTTQDEFGAQAVTRYACTTLAELTKSDIQPAFAMDASCVPVEVTRPPTPPPTATPQPTVKPALLPAQPPLPDLPALAGVEPPFRAGCQTVYFHADPTGRRDNCLFQFFDDVRRSQPMIVAPGQAVTLKAPDGYVFSGLDASLPEGWHVQYANAAVVAGLETDPAGIPRNGDRTLAEGMGPAALIAISMPAEPGSYLLELSTALARDGWTVAGGLYYWPIRVE